MRTITFEEFKKLLDESTIEGNTDAEAMHAAMCFMIASLFDTCSLCRALMLVIIGTLYGEEIDSVKLAYMLYSELDGKEIEGMFMAFMVSIEEDGFKCKPLDNRFKLLAKRILDEKNRQ